MTMRENEGEILRGYKIPTTGHYRELTHSGEFDFKIGLGTSFRLAFITSSAQIGSPVSRFADMRKLQWHKMLFAVSLAFVES